MNNALRNELSKKIFKDIGATPLSIGKVSLTDHSLMIKNKIIIEGNDNKFPIWYGECSSGLSCIITNIINEEEDLFEISGLFLFKKEDSSLDKKSPIIGFTYNWNNNSGDFFIKYKDQWVALELTQLLRLALGTEILVQEGILWYAPALSPDDEILDNLYSILEFTP